jgi:hypothetical protein
MDGRACTGAFGACDKTGRTRREKKAKISESDIERVLVITAVRPNSLRRRASRSS